MNARMGATAAESKTMVAAAEANTIRTAAMAKTVCNRKKRTNGGCG